MAPRTGEPQARRVIEARTLELKGMVTEAERAAAHRWAQRLGYKSFGLLIRDLAALALAGESLSSDAAERLAGMRDLLPGR